jgi:hypothetical protein
MKLFTLDQSLVLRRIGALGEDDRLAVKTALVKHLGAGDGAAS